MDQNKQLPLSKPPKVSIEQVSIPISVTPLVTQKRMATINRYNKLFFLFGLLAMAFGIFTWIELNRTTDELARYQAAFELFPDESILTIKNGTNFNLEITNFLVYELYINEEDSQPIFYKNMPEDFQNNSESKLILKSGESHSFTFLSKEVENKEVNGKKMLYLITGWKQEKNDPVYEFKHVPENGLIKLVD